ncbi:hypothetical protein GGS23DRAFT_144345 [Durotheca rogersii]|uniref:uncharacterized protein n=1 Tax=Durotheca rogersii TaxID=419775 RepID=UPI0022211810|nr:uncharacterized protein GGS23DRAFT_144345 [Durotheca rogersii]KAI5861670.1 hypothetical protein GGS23DRAFT_144345 [Durotheca rogersii]
MPSITSLPMELVLKILQAPCDPCEGLELFEIPGNYGWGLHLDSASLAAFARTSRRFRGAATEILYRTHGGSRAAEFAVRNRRIDILDIAASFRVSFRPPKTTRGVRSLLELACYLGYEDVASWLLDHGAEMGEEPQTWIDGTPAFRYSALETAVHADNTDVALMLLRRGACPFFWSDPQWGFPARYETVLHRAAARQQFEFLRSCVKEKLVPVDLESCSRFSALAMFVMHSWSDAFLEAIQTLVDLGADVNARTEPAMLSQALQSGSFAIATALLGAGAEVRRHSEEGELQLLHFCVGRKFVFRTGIAETESVYYHEATPRGQTYPLRGSIDGIRRLGPPTTPLGAAIRFGTPKVMAHFFDVGASLETTDYSGRNALDIFMDHYRDKSELDGETIEKMEVLLRHGGRIDVPMKCGQSLLQWAASRVRTYSDTKGLERLLTIATPKVTDERYLRSLLPKYSRSGPYAICCVLASHGISLSVKKSVAAARQLIRKRKELDSRAASWFSMLLDMGLSERRLSRLLTFALRHKKDTYTYIMLDRGVLAGPHSRPSWLPLAARWGNLVVIKRLLSESTVQVNDRCDYRRTGEAQYPLAIAFEYGHNEAALMLLEHGADPILPRTGPVCESGSNEVQSLPPFEMAIHRGADVDIVKEMWLKTPPESRPDGVIFMACVPRRHHLLCEWLEHQAKGGMGK